MLLKEDLRKVQTWLRPSESCLVVNVSITGTTERVEMQTVLGQSCWVASVLAIQLSDGNFITDNDGRTHHTGMRLPIHSLKGGRKRRRTIAHKFKTSRQVG